jgi:phage protein D
MGENKHLTPVWIIYVDGKRLDTAHEGALRHIFINDFLNGISTFSVLFDASESNIAETDFFSQGSQVSIHLGYKDDVQEVFSGEVHALTVKCPEYGTVELEVTGHNILNRLNRGIHYRTFEEKAVSEILKGLIDSYSLQSEVEDFGSSHAFTSQEGETDYHFIAKCAEAYGKNFFAAGNKVFIGDEISVRSDEIIYELGKSLIKFEATLNTGNQLSSVDCIGWDSQKGESFIGTARLSDIPLTAGGSKKWTDISKSGNEKSIEDQVGLNLKDADEAKQLALGALQKRSFELYTAEGTGEGNYKLRPGMRVTIKTVGKKFEGEYIAFVVKHIFDHTAGYITQFKLGRNMVP